MSTQHAKTTDALRPSPMACHCGLVPSLQSTLRLSPPLLLPVSRAALGAALPERPGSLQDEPKSAHTPSCAGRTAAGSLSLFSRLVGVGVLRPPCAVCAATLARAMGEPRELWGHLDTLPSSPSLGRPCPAKLAHSRPARVAAVSGRRGRPVPVQEAQLILSLAAATNALPSNTRALAMGMGPLRFA